MKKYPRLHVQIISLVLVFYCAIGQAMEVPIYDFPLQSYSQNTADFISPDKKEYTEPLLSASYQQRQMKEFYRHYYSTSQDGLSPWSAQMVRCFLALMKTTEPQLLDEFNNAYQPPEKKHFGENFKEKDLNWWNSLKENMDLNALALSEFKEDNRAIAINNSLARALPDNAPDFFHASLPGQGFPFDNLQESAIWTGTPLYVFGQSKDKAWSLVLSPDAYFAWIKSSDIAYVSPDFIHHWQNAAKANLIAITKTQTSVFNAEEQFQFTGFIGSVFPMLFRNKEQTSVLIPIKNKQNQAIITRGILDSQAASLMPLRASPKQIAGLINQLKNRPYGWGGAFFFNDCSQEMKSLFTPFGIWLPRNSSQMAKLSSSLDLTNQSLEERLALLKEKGHPLMTLIYIGGHVMLYIGTHKATAMTYQNVWGLSPVNHDKRYVIGQSVLFPLLKQYPENPDINSLANKSYFKLIYLDSLETKNDSAADYVNRILAEDDLLQR